nr:Mo-dependent nitrogenase C-terminal domain-containing protein [Chroococcidiopsis cubana]
MNPFYEQIIGLRFKCLSYLADKCGEDVASLLLVSSSLDEICGKFSTY